MKILVLRFDLLGDTILTLPFLENLRRNYPDAKITVAASSRGHVALEDCPFIDDIVVFDLTKEMVKIKFIFIINIVLNESRKIAEFIKKSVDKYDKCFLLTEHPLAYKIACKAKIPELIGFCPRPMPLLGQQSSSMTFTLKRYSDDCLEHVVERQLNLLEIANLKTEKKPYRIFLRPEDLAYAKETIAKKNKPIIVVHYGPKCLTDGWTETHFEKLMRILEKKYSKKYQLSINCGIQDKLICEKILKNLGDGWEILCERDFRRWVAILSSCRLLITMDTSAAHVSSGIGLPALVVYQEKKFERVSANWHPWMSEYRKICRKNMKGNDPNNFSMFSEDLILGVESLLKF